MPKAPHERRRLHLASLAGAPRGRLKVRSFACAFPHHGCLVLALFLFDPSRTLSDLEHVALACNISIGFLIRNLDGKLCRRMRRCSKMTMSPPLSDSVSTLRHLTSICPFRGTALHMPSACDTPLARAASTRTWRPRICTWRHHPSLRLATRMRLRPVFQGTRCRRSPHGHS